MQTENLQILESMFAGLSHNTILEEKLGLKGIYGLKNTGPKESLREEFCEIRDELALLIRRGLGTSERFFQLTKDFLLIPRELKWEDSITNLITDEGARHLLDNYLGGSAYTAAFYLGLISNVSYGVGPAVGNTMASHSGWTEAGATNTPSYSNATRPAPSFSAAATRTKATSANVSYSINGGTSVIVKGTFLTTNSTKDGTTGTLFSAGVFSNGDKTVSNGDTLTSSYSLTA